jgi:multiple antibiotic resistance protein
MESLDVADVIVTFLALMGPQKVLLSFARIARTLDTRSLRVVAVLTALASAAIGVVCALTAPWLGKFFHITIPALDFAAGILFFVYAVGLALGIHLDPSEAAHAPGPGGSGKSDSLAAEETPAAEADPTHPITSGFRALLLPFVVSPLAVAAALQESISATEWHTRWTVAGAFAIVALIDAVCAILFASWLGRAHDIVLEVLSRLLGILLAAVGIQLFLLGLSVLGVLDH